MRCSDAHPRKRPQQPETTRACISGVSRSKGTWRSLCARFKSMSGLESTDDDADDDSEVQRELIARGLKVTDVVDGKIGNLKITTEAIKRFKQAAGLVVDGIAGPKTKARLAQKGLLHDAKTEGTAPAPPVHGVVTWGLAEYTLPASLRPAERARQELQLAFDTWGEPTGLRFESAADELNADVVIRWVDNSKTGESVPDGLGGEHAPPHAVCCTQHREPADLCGAAGRPVPL